MNNNTLQQEQIQEQKEQDKLEDIFEFQIPVCGGNLKSPVDKMSDYISEERYAIGNRVYICNAD